MQNKVAKKFSEQVVKKDANKQYFCFVFSVSEKLLGKKTHKPQSLSPNW
jgi:hypothetical protein